MTEWVLATLGVMFVGLKLAGVITWSWWWVLAPFWIGAALFGLAALFYVLFNRAAIR